MKNEPSPARVLDQFYTRSDVAQQCVLKALTALDEAGLDRRQVRFLEPSAGTGAFLEWLPSGTLALDLDPQQKGIEKADFLSWSPPDEWKKRAVMVVGNPPFGKNASLALKFINHAASFSRFVAFILPRTFEKASLINKLDQHLHLLHQSDLAAESFIYEGQPYAVPVVFQIWERRSDVREPVHQHRQHPDFSFVLDPAQADFAFQRVGAAAGKVSRQGLARSPKSHYFIRVSPAARHDVQKVLNTIDWTPIKHRTAGNPSIGKSELIEQYMAVVDS